MKLITLNTHSLAEPEYERKLAAFAQLIKKEQFEENHNGDKNRVESLTDQEMGSVGTPGMRIDYIWCSQEVDIDKSEVICNGINYEVVSDHYGVMITEKGR